jgi:hypothetical protein
MKTCTLFQGERCSVSSAEGVWGLTGVVRTKETGVFVHEPFLVFSVFEFSVSHLQPQLLPRTHTTATSTPQTKALEHGNKSFPDGSHPKSDMLYRTRAVSTKGVAQALKKYLHVAISRALAR